VLNRNPDGGVVVLGQSLGGAIAIPVVAKEKFIKGAVIEAAYPSYRTIARDVLARSVILWILYPFYPFMISKKYDPVRFLAEIPPRPLFFIHGTADKVVPVKMTKMLYKKAREPKTIWIVEGAKHTGVRSIKRAEYERRVAEFFEAALNSPSRT
jgi:hypothetical protein